MFAFNLLLSACLYCFCFSLSPFGFWVVLSAFAVAACWSCFRLLCDLLERGFVVKYAWHRAKTSASAIFPQHPSPTGAMQSQTEPCQNTTICCTTTAALQRHEPRGRGYTLFHPPKLPVKPGLRLVTSGCDLKSSNTCGPIVIVEMRCACTNNE